MNAWDRNKSNSDLTRLPPSSSEQNLAEVTSKFGITNIQQEGEEKVEEVDNGVRWKCSWRKCETEHKSVEDAFDHAVEVHIRSRLTDESLNDDSEVPCEWAQCETKLCRGSLKKKIEWLEQHVSSRHSQGVRTFRCVMEGCISRFSVSRQLEDHIRQGHITKKKKRRVKVKPVHTCREPVYFPPSKGRCWTQLTIDNATFYGSRILLAGKQNNKIKYEVVRPKTKGTRKRKTSRKTSCQIVNTDREKNIEVQNTVFETEMEESLEFENIFSILDSSNAYPPSLLPTPPEADRESTSPCPVLLPETFDESFERSSLRYSPSSVVDFVLDSKNEPPRGHLFKVIKRAPNRKSRRLRNEKAEIVPEELERSISKKNMETEEYSPVKQEPEQYEIINQKPDEKSLETKEEIEDKPSKRKSRKNLKKKILKEIVAEEEPLVKRARKSLPYGVFKEDLTDNEDDYGFERVPESILKVNSKRVRTKRKKSVRNDENDEESFTSLPKTCKYDEMEVIKYAKYHKRMATLIDKIKKEEEV